MNNVTTIGVDLAKNVFQVHGVDASGRAVIRQQLRRRQVGPTFLQETATVSDRRGSLRYGSSLGAAIDRARP